MGWAVGYIGGRWVGYGVPSLCDTGDGVEINRGVSYLCGDHSNQGCGLFVCESHLESVAFDLETGDRIADDDPRWDTANDFREDQQYEWTTVCPRCAAGEPPYEPTPDTDEWVVHQLVDESWAKWREEDPERTERLILERRRAILNALRFDRTRAEEAEDKLLDAFDSPVSA